MAGAATPAGTGAPHANTGRRLAFRWSHEGCSYLISASARHTRPPRRDSIRQARPARHSRSADPVCEARSRRVVAPAQGGACRTAPDSQSIKVGRTMPHGRSSRSARGTCAWHAGGERWHAQARQPHTHPSNVASVARADTPHPAPESATVGPPSDCDASERWATPNTVLPPTPTRQPPPKQRAHGCPTTPAHTKRACIPVPAPRGRTRPLASPTPPSRSRARN